MKIIDAHLHTSFHRTDFMKTAENIGNKFNLEDLKLELKKNDIEFAVSITSDRKEVTPLEYEKIISLVKLNKGFIGVLGINPLRIDRDSVKKIEESLKSGLIKGLKIYPGYYHISPLDPVYNQFYQIAQKYKAPVIIHCGDTYKEDALVKYAQPLFIDELALKFRGVNFIIAHLGNPWTIDAAEVIYKNKNVYADISGLTLGKKVSKFTIRRVLEALDYIDNYDKILYGSDWPLVNMGYYIKIIKKIIPIKYQKKVFYENAKNLFKL